MKSFEDCLILNAQAILFVQLGHCEEAIRCIKDALERLQPRLESYVDHGIPSVNLQGLSNDRPYFSVPVMADAGVHTSSLLANDNNIFSFYPRMFNVTERDPRKFGSSKLLVLLLFNLAAAHHMHAAIADMQGPGSWVKQETAQDRQFRLTAVLKMYQGVIVAARTSLRADEVGGLLCIVTAAANNAGHLNTSMHNFPEMQSSLRLEMQLMGLSYGPCSIPPTDFEIFFSSIFVFLEGAGLSISPAA